MNTRSSTSTTRMMNQMAKAATKSATNVAPDNRDADGSVFSGGARRRRPQPAPPRPRPFRGASPRPGSPPRRSRSEEHTSELQSQFHLVCRLLLEKKKQK